MPPKELSQELIQLDHMAHFPQRWSTGPVLGKFLKTLRDEKRILANVCPRCGRTQLPPREVCAICRTEANLWKEVGPEGTLVSWDVVYYASPDPVTGQSREVPYTTANIQLDGSVGGATLWHELNETDPAKLRRGLRVRAVFAPDGQRSGAISDIQYFELI